MWLTLRGTSALTLRGIHYRGNTLSLEVNTTIVSVEVIEQAQSVTALHMCLPGGKTSALVHGKACSFERGVAASIRPAGTLACT
jgi:hypothetical protein